jgi:Flp pilus assembly protein TadD
MFPKSSNNILGALLFRAGRHEQAVKRLQEAVQKSPAKRGSAFDWLSLAMAQQKLGQSEDAKSCQANAEELLKAEEMAESQTWKQQLELKLLHREAKALVTGTKR